MKTYRNLLLKLYIKAHNFIYRQISIISVKLNNGVSPKHEIMQYYKFFIENTPKNSKVLDIGCGIGFVSYKVAEKAALVYGIDIEKNVIEIAQRIHLRDNIRYIKANVFNYDFNEKFDVIILSNVLEHIKERKKLLLKLKPLSNFILIRVPMIDRSWITLYKKKMGLEYRLDSTHQIEYTFNTFKKEIEDAGYKISNFSIQFGEIWSKITPN